MPCRSLDYCIKSDYIEFIDILIKIYQNYIFNKPFRKVITINVYIIDKVGRELEDVMVSFIKSRHQIKEFEFYSTGKNDRIREYLEKELKF